MGRYKQAVGKLLNVYACIFQPCCRPNSLNSSQCRYSDTLLPVLMMHRSLAMDLLEVLQQSTKTIVLDAFCAEVSKTGQLTIRKRGSVKGKRISRPPSLVSCHH